MRRKTEGVMLSRDMYVVAREVYARGWVWQCESGYALAESRSEYVRFRQSERVRM